jgi:hypothetical protein
MDNQCALGKWLYGEGQKVKFSKNSQLTFNELLKSHNEFHLCAGSIIKLINENNDKQAMVELRPTSKYIKISKNTVQLIKKLQHELDVA